jgi:hypothetical protein
MIDGISILPVQVEACPITTEIRLPYLSTNSESTNPEKTKIWTFVWVKAHIFNTQHYGARS